MRNGVICERCEIGVAVADINRQPRSVVAAGRVIRNYGAIGAHELLQSSDVRIAAFLIIYFHSHVELLGGVSGIDAQLRGIALQSFLPMTDVTEAADGHHHANAVTLKVVDDGGVHSGRDTVYG